MARAFQGNPKFDRPDGYILNMLLFLLAVGCIVFYLSPWSPQPTPLLIDAFNANPALNGLILLVLLFGVAYNLSQAEMVSPAMRWLEAFNDAQDPNRARMPREPRLIKAVSKILIEAAASGSRLTPDSTRAILDSIGTRMDEARETGRYVMNLLVFLGLLGTFWGLLQTVNAVADTINGLANAGGAAEDAVSQLIANLREPLSGMGTAFSSSLFGLGGSLIVGFLDLQAGQAQNRFYSGLEDWLAGNTESVRVSKGGASYADDDLVGAIQALEAALAANTETQIKAAAGQTAELKDEIRALNRTLIRVGGGDKD